MGVGGLLYPYEEYKKRFFNHYLPINPTLSQTCHELIIISRLATSDVYNRESSRRVKTQPLSNIIPSKSHDSCECSMYWRRLTALVEAEVERASAGQSAASASLHRLNYLKDFLESEQLWEHRLSWVSTSIILHLALDGLNGLDAWALV